MFIWECDNFIEKKNKTNHEDQFKINQMLKDKIEKQNWKNKE